MMGRATQRFQRASRFEPRRSEEWVAAKLREAASGDERAWGEIVEEFGGMIWAIARRHRLCHAASADVVQTTWLRLAENVGRLREPGRLGAWLATTARRECLRTLCASARELPDPEPPEIIDAGTASVDGALIAAERDAAVRSALKRLPDRDRTLLRMLVAESPPSYQKIGLQLEMPIGSIGPTRGRALTRLRRELERHDSTLDLAA
jgi:RNA polymerase sigma factor (sigma-70 family)